MSPITETIDWSQKFDFGGPRTRPIMGICIHTTESPLGSRAESVAQYQLDSRTGSYHRLVDAAGRVLIENTDDWTTWSVGNQGNDLLLHISCVAYARMSRAEWLAPSASKMFDALAYQVAQWSKAHSIPLVVLDAADLVAGRRGLYGHDDCRVWGGTDHTDPGPGFPWDELVKRAQAYANGTTTESENIPMAQLDEILSRLQHIEAQLGDPGGWPQGGGRTLYDLAAAIASKLDVPNTRDTLA